MGKFVLFLELILVLFCESCTCCYHSLIKFILVFVSHKKKNFFMHSVINVTACWQWYVLSFLYRRGEGLLVLYIQKLHSDVIFPTLRSLKILFLNYCKAITLHICIFPYVIVISSKKIFFLRRMLYLIHTSSQQQTICQYQTTASVGFFFRILLSSRDRKSLLLRVLALPAPML